jgi:hypothetical protein
MGAGLPAAAQGSGAAAGAGQYGPPVRPLRGAAVGDQIARVELQVAASSGDAARDDAALRAARAATGVLIGRSYRPVLVDTALASLVSAGTVRAASHRPVFDGARGALGILVSLDLSTPQLGASAPPTEVFPVIHQDDRTKLTFILSAGAGVYSDIDSWFGRPELFNEFNPLAGNLPGSETAWGEGYLEVGIGGATRLGDSDFYVFGAASGLSSFSGGQDIFTDANRNFLHPEKGYGGLHYANTETGNTAHLSFGRQTWTLNSGFLISMISGSANAGERGATYLGPRNAADFAAIATGEFGRARSSAFYIDSDELEDLESNTTFAGLNLGWQFTEGLTADASFITIPTSDSTYQTPSGEALAREGTTTWGVRGLWRPTTPDHLWLEGEAYTQTNPDYDMDAQAWYGTVGYIWGSWPWSPSISYRYVTFSGDDPNTDTFERFDGLMINGFGNWLPGMSFGKVYRNANLNAHRVQANVVPREGMNLTFEWHRLRADQLNNLGGNPALSTLTSSDIGKEYTVALRWGIDRNLFLQAVASHALPGRALRAIGADVPWTTLQASLYVSL